MAIYMKVPDFENKVMTMMLYVSASKVEIFSDDSFELRKTIILEPYPND